MPEDLTKIKVGVVVVTYGLNRAGSGLPPADIAMDKEAARIVDAMKGSCELKKLLGG